jgi:capsular exopolysaccharide synthesis family protein
MEKSQDRTYTGTVTRPSTGGSDPRDFLRLLWRRKWILLPVIVLIPLATYVVASRAHKEYQASAVIQLQATAADPSASGAGDLSAAPTDKQTNDRVAALIGTSAVADEAAKLVHEPKGSLNGAATASADENTGFITIVVTQGTAGRAARVANAFADAVRATRAAQGRSRLNAAIANTETQIKNLPKGTSAERDQLDQQLQQLQTLLQAQAQNALVIQSASPPGAPSSPHPRRTALLAFLLALVVGAGLVALVDRMDRRLRDPDELDQLTGAPLLVALPEEAFPGSAPNPGIPLVFQMLRDSLTYFNVDEDLDSVMVVSSLKGEGKTTVSANLAVSFARSGKRVVALCCDLRNPQLALRMGVDCSQGLTTVLRDGGKAVDLLQPVEPFGENLMVLPGGPVPPNPSELLGSARMASVLEELKQACDILIVDTPPLLLVSDAFGLLPRVSGTVGVTRLDVTPRDAVRRMAEVVDTTGGRLLGMVATGLRPTIAGHGAGYGYGYGYGYGETPEVSEQLPQPLVRSTENGHAPVAEADLKPPVEPERDSHAGPAGPRTRIMERFRSSSS